jgi:hypothetical protein
MRTRSRRLQALATEDSEDRQWEKWAPADLPVFDPAVSSFARDRELQRAADALNAVWRTTDDDESPRLLLRRIARELNELAWSDVADVTDDFAASDTPRYRTGSPPAGR